MSKTRITVSPPPRRYPVQKTLGDDDTTIFSSPQSMDSAERDAVKKGEARGKLGYVEEHPKCRLKANTKAYDEGYGKIDWSK